MFNIITLIGLSLFSSVAVSSMKSYTISGISSGGFMANQMSTIYSETIKGVGTVAGGFYYCAQDYLPRKVEADKNTIGTQNLFLFEPTTRAISDTLNPFVILNGVNPASWFRPSKGNPIYQSVSVCMGEPVKAKLPFKYLTHNEKSALVDPLENIKQQKVVIFHGKKDSVLNFEMKNSMQNFYNQLGVNDKNILVIEGEGSHNFPTDKKDGIDCDSEEVPYVAACNFNMTEKILSFLLGRNLERNNFDLKHIYVVDQNIDHKNKKLESANWQQPSPSIAPYGYMYASDKCLNDPAKCELHVALHGCKMSDSYDEDFQIAFQNQVMTYKVVTVSKKSDSVFNIPNLPANPYDLVRIEDKKNHYGLLKFVVSSGYVEYAEKNDLIILFPQTWITENNFPYNPKGCWDWFGWTSKDYATNVGLETSWLNNFIQAVQENPTNYILNEKPHLEEMNTYFPTKF